jgi:hypothetical protein
MKLKNLCVLLLIAVIAIGAIASIAQADTARVKLKGPSWGVTYTIQIRQNGVLRAQQTGIILTTGLWTYSYTVPSGCGYIADVWMEGVGVHSNTWPSKCVSGTTHLGCLQFNNAGEPEPWTGNCP